MGDLSAHFSRKEMACHCGCGFNTVNPALVEKLEAIRAHFGAPVIVNSACRCPKHNASQGGAVKSQHVLGNAADIRVKGFTPSQVADFVDKAWPDTGGLGRYRTFTHVDVRPPKARWNG